MPWKICHHAIFGTKYGMMANDEQLPNQKWHDEQLPITSDGFLAGTAKTITHKIEIIGSGSLTE